MWSCLHRVAINFNTKLNGLRRLRKHIQFVCMTVLLTQHCGLFTEASRSRLDSIGEQREFEDEGK